MAKNVSQPFLISLLTCIAEITLDITPDLMPCTITSDWSDHLNTTIFLPQSTIARCLDNQSIPRIKLISLNGKVIKSTRNSLAWITMGQFLYTLFTLTLCPYGLVTCMSYANCSTTGILSNTMFNAYIRMSGSRIMQCMHLNIIKRKYTSYNLRSILILTRLCRICSCWCCRYRTIHCLSDCAF